MTYWHSCKTNYLVAWRRLGQTGYGRWKYLMRSDLKLVNDVNTFVARVFEVDLDPDRKLPPATTR